MISNKLKYLSVSILAIFAMASCDSDDNEATPTNPGSVINPGPDSVPVTNPFEGLVFEQADQMGRPAINTVFVSSAQKDEFNVTVPSEQGAKFSASFKTALEGLSPAYGAEGDTNALGQTSEALTSLLATDVLNVATSGETVFFSSPTLLLTGRGLADDVLSNELLLIFGGEDGTENPTLSDDNVDANDKEFLTSFPYLATPW